MSSYNLLRSRPPTPSTVAEEALGIPSSRKRAAQATRTQRWGMRAQAKSPSQHPHAFLPGHHEGTRPTQHPLPLSNHPQNPRKNLNGKSGRVSG